jgi:hypothetical protein
MKRRRYLIAVSLLLLSLVSVGYSLSSGPGKHQSSGNGEKSTSPRGDEKWQKVLAKVPRLEVELLETGPKPFSGGGVNLFRPLQTPRPVAVARPLPPPPPVPKVESARQAVPLPNPVNFLYLGQVLINRTNAVFLRHEEEVFILRKGELFGPREEYRLVAIHPEQLLLSRTGSDALISVPFADRGPGLMARSGPGLSSFPPLSAASRFRRLPPEPM